MKNQKGITLVALIITIIVMLILAGATMYLAWSNVNILTKAQTAVDEYSNAAGDIQNQLNTIENILGQYVS